MDIQLIRHASLWLKYGEKTLLIDPMFADKEQFPPFPNTPNDKRNPLIPLPASMDKWSNPDLVIITHVHLDHWDTVAANALPKSTPILCQPENKQVIMDAGFLHVTAFPDRDDVATLDKPISFFGLQIYRTGGRHGTGEIGERMGTVSGVVLTAEDEPTLYVTGDSIWCEDVAMALDKYKPTLIIANAGGARFVTGDPITMDERDITKLCEQAPDSKIVAVHMDAINHCLVTREQLRKYVDEHNLTNQVIIPEDGEKISFH